jgi:hypothetical protein
MSSTFAGDSDRSKPDAGSSACARKKAALGGRLTKDLELAAEGDGATRGLAAACVDAVRALRFRGGRAEGFAEEGRGDVGLRD